MLCVVNMLGVRLERDYIWLPVPIRAWRCQSDSAHCSAESHPKLHLHHRYRSYSCCRHVINRLGSVVSRLHLHIQYLQEDPEDQGKRIPEGRNKVVIIFLCQHPVFFSPAGIRSGASVGDTCDSGVGGLGWHIAHLPTQQYHVFLDPGLRHNL